MNSREYMLIAINGMGRFGKALGKALISKGYKINFGVSNISKYQQAIAEFGDYAYLSSIQEAIANAEIIVLAVPYDAACQIASVIPDWNNRIVIDVSTPLLPDASGLEIGFNTSAAEEIAIRAHGARVIKAFNTVGAKTIAEFSSIKKNVFLPVCGDDVDARNQVITLANDIGFHATDVGPLNVARFLEPFAMMWIQLAVHKQFGASFEFGLLGAHRNA